MRLLLISLIFIISFSLYTPLAAAEGEILTFEEISPASSPDFVVLLCHENLNLANYSVTDMDGTDSPLSSEELICSKDEKVKVVWTDSGEDEAGFISIFLTDTTPTNTKDQLAIQHSDGTFLDAVVYWDGESTFDTASEIKDIEILIEAGLWTNVESSSALVIQADQVFERINYTHLKDAWQEMLEEEVQTEEEITEFIEEVIEEPVEEPIEEVEEPAEEPEVVEENKVELSEEEALAPVQVISPVRSGGSSRPFVRKSKLRTVFSPQFGITYVKREEPLQRISSVIITAISPQDEEEDYILFSNSANEKTNLSLFFLEINGGEKKLDDIIIPSKDDLRFNIDLPNTNAFIRFGTKGSYQVLSYDESQKGQYYVLNQKTGLWEWSSEPFIVEKRMLRKRTEREKRPIEALLENENMPPGGEEIASGVEVGNAIKILQPSFIWYFVALALSLGLIVFGQRTLQTLFVDKSDELESSRVDSKVAPWFGNKAKEPL